MSAPKAQPVPVPESTGGGSGSDGTRDLLIWVNADPELAANCSAAVDPLEIAARLETYGMSSRVAVDVFGFPDVFTAAQAVYDSLPFQNSGAHPAPSAPMGGPTDLLRGALYAIPALLFTVAVTGFTIRPAWWALPVGLTVAWGVSQGAAVIAWALRGREDDRSNAIVPIVSMLCTLLLCLAVAVVARRYLGGGESNVVVAVCLGVYIAASGMLLFRQKEWLLAACLLPAAIGSVLALGAGRLTISHRAASWAVVASACLVVVAANRHLFTRGWHRPALLSIDRQRTVKYVFYGLGCGLLTSVFIGFSAASGGAHGSLVIAVLPLLLTLGLMEWQLRSFRSRATGALGSSSDLGRFARRVWAALLRSVGSYVAALAVLSAVGIIVARAVHAEMVPLLLLTVGCIGVTFFLALLFETAGRINLVLVCWAATFTVLGVILAIDRAVDGHITPTAGIVALLVSSWVAIVCLLALAHRVLTSPFAY